MTEVERVAEPRWLWHLAFPAEAGNEVAIRLGANDSLTNNFSAGDYPGQGNRKITEDGHFGTITLSTVH